MKKLRLIGDYTMDLQLHDGDYICRPGCHVESNSSSSIEYIKGMLDGFRVLSWAGLTANYIYGKMAGSQSCDNPEFAKFLIFRLSEDESLPTLEDYIWANTLKPRRMLKGNKHFSTPLPIP